MNRKEIQFWGALVPKNGCWEWSGAGTGKGHGRLRWSGRQVCAHRLAAYLSGLISALDLEAGVGGPDLVLHHCDNPLCCNPDHIYVGTQSQNLRDAYVRGRRVPYHERGTAHPNSRFTDAQIREVRKLYALGGKTQAQIAELFGASQTWVSQVIRRKRYQDVSQLPPVAGEGQISDHYTK